MTGQAREGSHLPAGFIPDLGRCACGKVRYRSRADARRFARKRNMRGLNAYQCGETWHLGHAPRAVKRGDMSRSDIRPRGSK